MAMFTPTSVTDVRYLFQMANAWRARTVPSSLKSL